MYAHELYEQNKPRVVVTYPGRFQPFHQGHAGVFAQLQKKFGRDSVYILTSNDTSSAKSPFNFSDKYQLMTAAGVPGDKIIETNQMYKLPDSIDAANTIFITAVGAPDADRLNPDTYTKRDQKDKEGNVTKPAGSPSYYKTWGGPETPVTADQHGYVIIIPEIHKEVTIKGKKYDVSHGTECRNLWNSIRNDAKARTEFLTQMYARPSQELAAIFDKIPQATAEDISADSQSSTSPIHGVELKQGVAEAFDQPYKLKWEKSEHGDYDALATLDDGTYLSIMFNLGDLIEDHWMVEFYRNNSQEVTGEGDAQRVFATVLTAIQQFIKKKKPESLFFSAVKENDPTGSRTRLYDRLVQRYANGLGYNLQKEDYPEQTGYRLTKVKQGVAEGSQRTQFTDEELDAINQYLDDDLSFQELGTYPGLIRKIASHFGIASIQGHSGEMNFYDRLVQARAEGDIPEQGVAEGLSEAREGAMREIIRKELPSWPDYVIKDWISSRIKNEEDLKNLQGWLGELNKMVRPNSWQLHQKMFLTFDMLNPRSRYFMKTKRKFGDRNPFLIPRDKERLEDAIKLVQAKGIENLPPISMLQHDNGLELCEGWHRTMAAFRLHPEGFYINAWIGQAGQQGVAEGNNQSSAKTGIYQSEVYGARAYHSKCLEKGCDWESRRYDRIKQAQDAAKKHAQTHIKSGMAEGKTVTRIDSKPITDFASSLKAYKHTDDWSQSGLDTGDDSYWKNKNLKTNTTKGLFAGDPRRTALYATGNAHETRYVEFTLDGQPIVYFDKKDLPAMRSRKTYLTVFDADNFKQLPTGEWFSQNPGTPIEQMPIGDPFKYIADQGWIVRVTDDLDKVFNQVKKMHKAGKIAQYGAEGMNESKQGVAEGFMALGPNRIRTEMNGPNAGKIVKDPESLQDMSADDFFKKYPELKQSWEQAYKQQVSNRTSAGQAAAQAAIDKRYNDLSWMTPEEQAQYKQLAAKDQATMQATDTRTYGAERYLKQLFQQKMDAKKAASMLKVHWAPLKQLESFLQGKVNNKIELSAYLAPNTESLGKTRWTSAYDPTVGIVLDGHITVGGRGDLGSDQYKMIAGQRGQQKYPSRPGQIDPTLSMDTSVHHEVLIDNWKIKEIVLPADIPPEIDRLVQQYKIPVRRLGNPQGMAEDAAGVGVVAKTKKMARDPRYSMSITKDVKPSTPKNMLRAFRLSEDSAVSEEQIISMVKSFLPLAMRELKLKKLPKIVIKKHIETHDGQATFGRFVNEEEKIYLGIADRHPVDILRTLAHELVHFKQHEQGRMEPDSGDTGSPIENEANAVAGVLMRYFNKKYPNAVKSSAVSLDESLFRRYQQFKENGDEADEVKKQKNLIPFPKGTVKVDVSDVYDWYKIGQEISDLDDADPADFGKGPPQTVMAFGSEPEEHRYLKDLKRLGLKTHDIDENFADGRNPQDKGDSKRYNVPTKGKISTLRKIAKQGGRRGQLAHWMANMRSGKNKK